MGLYQQKVESFLLLANNFKRKEELIDTDAFDVNQYFCRKNL